MMYGGEIFYLWGCLSKIADFYRRPYYRFAFVNNDKTGGSGSSSLVLSAGECDFPGTKIAVDRYFV